MATMKKVSYLYEIPLFYLILCGVNLLFASDVPAFIGIDPSPFWIGILLFGIRYGVMAGLLAGFLSALLYLAGAWFFLERYLFEEIDFYVLPSFFLLMGAMMGSLSGRYRQQISHLSEKAANLETRKDQLKKESRVLSEINRGLEKRIVTQTGTLVTLYEGAKRLEKTDLEELYPSILDFIAKTLGAEEASLYLKKEGGWELAHQLGWKDFQRRPRLLKWDEGITGLAGFSNKMVTIRDFLAADKIKDPSPRLLGDALMAGPLRRGEPGEVHGVIAIQKMPLLSLNSATMNLFQFLLDWASRSVGHAFYLKQLKEEEILDPEYGVYSARYFFSRGHQEFLRSKTYYLPLSLGIIHAAGFSGLDIVKKKRWLSAISQLLKESVRPMDVVARFEKEESEYPFAILWITASETQGREMREKILQNYAKLGLKEVSLEICLSTFSPKLKNFEEFLQGGQSHVTRKMG